MNTTPCFLLSLSAAALLSGVVPWTGFAQAVDPTPNATTTTTTTTTTDPNNPAASTSQTTVTTTAQPTPVGQHTADIELTVSRGRLQAYFGRASRGEKLEVGSASINIKLPSRATVTKLANRDDDSPGSQHITADNPWHVVVPFDGPGRYVFNISDWDDDAVVTSCVVKVDGQVIFSGHGRSDDFNGWTEKFYGESVRKSGSREIAFIVAGDR